MPPPKTAQQLAAVDALQALGFFPSRTALLLRGWGIRTEWMA